MNEIVTLALFLASVMISIGFLGSYLFKRTGVPDMLFLMALGVFFGPILGVFNPASIMGLAPYIAALSLVIILFDGGLALNLYQVFSESPRAVLLAVSNFMASLIVVALFVTYIMHLPLLYGIFFGSILGASSSVVTMSLTMRMNVSDKCKTVLSLETAIADVLCVVISLVVIDLIVTGHTDIMALGGEIINRFSTGAVVGVIFGVIWLSILQRVSKEPYVYILTLAVVFFAYSTSESFGGNGALSSLLFGIMLGNEKDIFRFLKGKMLRDVIVDAEMRRFDEEIAFMIRSFFFVYLGLIFVVVHISWLLFGVALSFLLLVVRYGAVALSSARSPLCNERSVMSAMLARGEASAVLCTLPMQHGLQYADLYLNLTIVIIILTSILCTILMLTLSRKRIKK